MARKTFVTVDGTHKQAKKAFVTLDGVYRGVKKAFVTLNGAYRQCFSSDVKWRKYDCDYTAGYYERTNGGAGGITMSGSATLYSGYGFSAESGFYGTGYRGTYGLENSSAAYGKYAVDKNSVFRVTSITTATEFGPTMIKLNGSFVARCRYIEPTYAQGEGYYGQIVAEDGALPEDGELCYGSVAEGYCALKIGDSYYYYTLCEDWE